MALLRRTFLTNSTASQKEIESACDFAAASEFIDRLPNKYETLIGENGEDFLVDKNREYLLREQY